MTTAPANNIEWTVPKEWHLRKVRAELSGVFTFGSPAKCLYVGDGGSRELSGAAEVGLHAVLLPSLDLKDLLPILVSD